MTCVQVARTVIQYLVHRLSGSAMTVQQYLQQPNAEFQTLAEMVCSSANGVLPYLLGLGIKLHVSHLQKFRGSVLRSACQVVTPLIVLLWCF